MQNFSFDEWAALYESDPVEFERRRKEVVEAEILKAPIRSRSMLRLIQLECDTVHQTMDPLAATVEISNMMIRKLNQLTAPLTSLQEISEDIDRQ